MTDLAIEMITDLQEKEMFVWKVKFSTGGVSAIVNNAYTITSETLTGALKKAKRLDDEFNKECFEAGDDPEASTPIGIELVYRLDQ